MKEISYKNEYMTEPAKRYKHFFYREGKAHPFNTALIKNYVVDPEIKFIK